MGEIDAHVDPSVLEGGAERPSEPWWVGRACTCAACGQLADEAGQLHGGQRRACVPEMNSVTAAHVYKSIHPRDPSGCPWPSWSGVTFLVRALLQRRQVANRFTFTARPLRRGWSVLCARCLRWGVDVAPVRSQRVHARPGAAAYAKKPFSNAFSSPFLSLHTNLSPERSYPKRLSRENLLAEMTSD